MFDSPLEWCSRCKVWVALDQTFAECSRARDCTLQECPLVVFLKPQAAAAASRLPWRASSVTTSLSSTWGNSR
jgi:hypothetical protein